MKNILLESNRRILEAFARSNVLLGFDFDGTLAPIVNAPERSKMRPRTSRLLKELSGLYPCVVISGRSRSDLRQRLTDAPRVGVVGNHGVEPWGTAIGLIKKVDRWRPILQKNLAQFPGVKIEDKAYSISIHYRHSREKTKARAAIRNAIRNLGEVRVIGGLQVVNILPKEAPHKGIALQRECERVGCSAAIYVGDDDTDEDVFASDRPSRLLTIRVGAKAASAASYCLPSQTKIDRFLRILVGLRGGARRVRGSSVQRPLAKSKVRSGGG